MALQHSRAPQHTVSTGDKSRAVTPAGPSKDTQPAQPGRGKGTGSVRQFLAAMRPPLDEFTAILVQGGIHNQECLEALIAMSEKQQRGVLERLPLTVFQVQVICNALEQHGEE